MSADMSATLHDPPLTSYLRIIYIARFFFIQKRLKSITRDAVKKKPPELAIRHNGLLAQWAGVSDVSGVSALICSIPHTIRRNVSGQF